MHLCSNCNRRTVIDGRGRCSVAAGPAVLAEQRGESIDSSTIARCDSFVRIGDGKRLLTDSGGRVKRDV